MNYYIIIPKNEGEQESLGPNSHTSRHNDIKRMIVVELGGNEIKNGWRMGAFKVYASRDIYY